MRRTANEASRILFTGYAPVHFVCFQSLYQRLRRIKGVEVFLSGGRDADPMTGARAMTAAELYAPFRIPANRVLKLEQIKKQSFDLVFCAHVSGYFPKEDKERVQLFHGVSFRNMAVRRDVLVYDRLFLVGPYMRRLFTEQQLLRDSDSRLVNVGFPKLDRLVDGTLKRTAILSRLGLSGRRPVVLYAPTGQKDNSLEHTGEAMLERLKATGKYDILIKLHDHPRDRATDWPRRLRPLLDSHTRLVNDYDVVPYLFVADLLISDASSVSNEYALLDRPMVFLDVPQLLAGMEKKGVALDLDTWGRKGGVTARWPDDAVEAVAWSLAHPRHGSPIRRSMARDLFYNPGRATDAALRWTQDRLGMEGEETNGARARSH
ncbi:MAG TPA: CDP-glycerol glycerophosphotransferase family protein [Gemmatimonadales bacterium]|nr:CDP-glycerol glycerophosphotransferase family protein [Gemmatimonadales bacterium]